MRISLPRAVHRLQWRLTALCVVSAILSVTLINLLGFSLTGYQLLSEENLAREIRQEIQKSLPKVAPFFAPDGTPDRRKLTRWLDRAAADSQQSSGESGWSLTLDWHTDATQLVLTRPDGVVQIASPDQGVFAEDKPLSPQLTPKEQALFQAAQQTDEILVEKVDGRFVAALRYRIQGRVVALVFIRSGVGPDLWRLWKGVPTLIGSMAIGIGLGSILVGGIIGSLMARRITQRLERTADVAQQWAAGKLSASIPEGPDDELGTLERSLNQMALRLEQVFTLQGQVATLQERERITHELHDTLKQEVFATGMLLGTAQEQLERGQLAPLRTSLEQLVELSQQLQSDLGAILSALPFTAETHSLPELLPLWLGEWSRRSGIVATHPRATASFPLTPDQLFQVRSLLHEALSNVARHSQASQVIVTLSEDATHYTLRLEDNGIGLLLERTARGMGMATMRERARALPGGSLTIEGAPKRGTAVVVAWQKEGALWTSK